MADPEDDDAALAWAGDEKPAAPKAAPVVEPAETRVELVEAVAPKQQMPAALLVTYGILAGGYLIFTLGWVTSVLRYNDRYATSTEPLNAFMFGLGEILAVASPVLWFTAALVLTRGRKPVVRLLVLLVGLVAVLPWPFVLGVWQ